MLKFQILYTQLETFIFVNRMQRRTNFRFCLHCFLEAAGTSWFLNSSCSGIDENSFFHIWQRVFSHIRLITDNVFGRKHLFTSVTTVAAASGLPSCIPIVKRKRPKVLLYLGSISLYTKMLNYCSLLFLRQIYTTLALIAFMFAYICLIMQGHKGHILRKIGPGLFGHGLT